MQCKLKFGAKVVNEDFELEDGKYNAIVSNISSPVFNEKGDLVKEGVFEAMTFNNKAEADKYIDDRYNRLLQEYNKLQNNALNDLQKELVEYQKERAIEEAEAAFEGVETEEFDDDIDYGDSSFPIPYNPDDANESLRIEKEINQNRRKRKANAAVKKSINNIFLKITEIMADFDNKEALEKVGEEGLINAMYKEIGKLRAISKALNYEMTEQEKADYKEIEEFVYDRQMKVYRNKMFSDDAIIRYAAFFDSLELSDQYKYRDIFNEMDEEVDEDTRNEIIRLQNEFLEKYRESEFFEESNEDFEEDNFVIISLEPNSVALTSDINIVETVEFEDFPKEAITQEIVDGLKVLMEENKASLELMGNELAIIIREDKPGIVVNGKTQEKPKVKAVILTKEQALEIINTPIQAKEEIIEDTDTDTGAGTDTGTSFEEEPFDADVDEKIDEETDTTVVGDVITVDPDTGETLPYNLKASGTPVHRQKNLGSVLIYSTVKPSQTKTVNGVEQIVNSKHETAMGNLWDNNNYKEEYGEDKLQEFIDKSKEHIDYLTKNGKIKEGTTIAYRKAKRSIYKNYNHELKLKILNENQHEVLLMGVLDNGVFYPIGEVPYHDGPFDSTGKSLKNKFIGTDEERRNYNNLYHTIKSLWENTGYDPIEHKGYTHNYQATQTLAPSDRLTIENLIVDRQEEVYFMSLGGTIYKYNRDNEEGKWEDITTTKEGLEIKKSRIKQNIQNYNTAIVKIGEDYEFIDATTDIVDTSHHDKYNRFVNDLLNLNAVNKESTSEVARNNEGFEIIPIDNSSTEFTFGNPEFNLTIIAKKTKNDSQLIDNKGINRFKIHRKNGTNILTKTINLADNASLSIVIGKDNKGNVKMKVYLHDKNKKTKLNLTETAIDLGTEFTIDRFLKGLQGIENLINNQGKGILRVDSKTKRNIADNPNNITNIILLTELKRRIVIKPNDYPDAQYSDTYMYEDQDTGTETGVDVDYESEKEIANDIADFLLATTAVSNSNKSGFVKADNFNNTDYTKQVNVFYHNGNAFIGGVSSGKNVVIGIERLEYPNVKGANKSKEENAALEAYNDYMNGLPSDIIPIGIMTSARESGVSYLVNDSGDIVSVATSSTVFVNNKTVSERIKTGVQNNNRSILGVSEEQQTGNIIEDIDQELAYSIQRERAEELKNKITSLENKLKSITEKTSASASSVMDKLEQGDIKNSIKSLKSELNSAPPVEIPDSLKDLIVTTIVHGKEQTIFTTYNLDRTVVFVQIDGKRYGFYQSTKGTSGKIENHWYPFYGKASRWVVKDGGGKNWKYNTQASPELQEKLKNASERLNREYGNAQFKNAPYIHDESEFETNELIGSNIVDEKQNLQKNYEEYDRVKKETAEKGFKQPKGAEPFRSLRTQQTTPATETDIYTNTEQKQQKQKMPTFKFMDDGILNFSGFQIENDLTKQKDVYDLLVKKLGKDKVDGLKGKVYSLNGQWLFNHNGKRLVMFVKVGDFLNPVYFSSQGTSGKSLTWHPFFGIDSQAGWIYKREFNPSTGKLSFSNRWKEYSNSILLLENVLQDLFLNFNVQDFKSELLNKIEEQDLRNNIFVNNQVLEDYVVENGEMRVVTTDSSDQYVVTMLYYMNQKTTPATKTDVYADTEQDNNTSGAQNTSTPTETTTTNKANTIGDFDFSLFNDTQKLKTDENQTDEKPIDESQTDEKPIDAKDVQEYDDLPFSTSETKQTQQDISEAKRVLANIVPFDVEEMDPMIQNMVNDRTPIGAFYKNVIYLLDGTVKFHEAFHGVFRTLLTDQEVKETLDAAKKKYAKPTLEDLRKLRNLTEKNKQLTTKQLIDLYYEEKLAEDFQNYMDTGKSFFQRVWQKIMDIINFITGKDGDRIYALFRSIEQGKYAKSKQRTQSPFAFREPAFATVNSIRSNAYGKAAQYFMPPNQTKIVASLVAKEIFDDKIDRKKRSEYFPYFRKVRETFNPKKWYEFFKFNNDPNLVANMMTIIDYYNALAVPGDTLYMIDANGKIIPIVNADNIINKNLNGLIRDVDGLLKFYVNDENTDVDDEFNDDSYEDDNGESVELFGKDSYKFGGFKSESKAMRNLMSIITYNKPLFYMANGYMPTPDGFTGEIIMPSQAESLYNKITLLTTGATKEDILERIKEGANDDKNPDIKAFYDYIMGKISQESGIDNRDVLIQEPGKYNNSPTYNLVLKSFYKNNHDYVHLIRDNRSGKSISYYPNKRSYINSAVESWDKNLERLLSNTNDYQKRKNDISEFELIMLDTYRDIDSKEFMREMNKAAKLLFNATGISVSPLYLKYSYVKINNVTSSGLFNLTVPHIDAGTNKSILTELTRLPDQYSDNTAIRKMAEGSVLFDDKQTSFMLRNAENELIYTSLYNSYDTEIFNAIQRSFVNDSFRPEILRQALENMGYFPSFIERFMSMVSLNPIFFQEGISAEDFNIMYSYGYGNNSYNKLNEDGRKAYRVGVYASPPADIKAKKGNKRLYNPFIIEAKNTNKLFTFSDTATGSTYENGELSLTDKTIEALKSLYLIEKDSVLRYQNDIQKLITTGNIEALIKDYHYKEMTIDGFTVKVIFDGENYYEVEDKWDRTTFKTHQVHQGYTVRKINKPSGFKNPRGAEMFNFKGVQTIDDVEQWAKDKYTEFVNNGNDYEVKNMLSNTGFDKATDNDVVAFYFNDMIASASIQYLMFGGSPSINHKDFIDVTKRNAGINANGSSIGNTSTKFAMITSIEESIDNDIIKQQNSGDSLSQDVQDAQNYATPLWYFSKYAKYKGVASEKGELRDIALKVVAGIKLNTKEISFLEKNNMLLIDRKIVVRNTFVYDKTSVHIQAREKTSRLLVSNEVALNNWKKYLANPSPEAYNKLIEPMYVAKPGFEYHHNMLNSMEAQGIDIVMATSASKNSSFNIASDPSQLRGFNVDDRFIHEQVRTDNIKKKITDPTQALALNWSEHQDGFFAKLADKFVELQAKRMEIATNAKIATFFNGKDNQPDYEAIWDAIKNTISVNDPQLYELLDVQQGNPKYNWNIPIVNDKVIAAFMSAMSKEGLSQKVKGSSLNLVSSYGHGQDLNWKVTDDRYPGTYFSEVYVSQYFLDKMGMQVGDVMWGTRIPTQDKHSMGNLKIKGVIEGPYAMSVMLPKELLFLSGADHDLDKIYVKTFAYNYSQDIRDRVYDGDTNIIELYNEIVKNNPEYNPSDVMNDLMLMTQIAITHNVGNQSIYATKASLKAIKDSGVRGVEKPIKSTIAFDDRNTSEESNYTSKGGIGPAAVLNIVYQLMVKYFPNQFKFTNVEGKRVNDLISTQISGMTDDPKEQLMSRYGLSKSNINKVIGMMSASGIPYKEALVAIRDQEYTYAKPDESFDILKGMFNNDLTSLNPKAQQYESEGYVIEYGEEVTTEEGQPYRPIRNMYHPKFNVELAKVYDNVFYAIGTLSRLNRAMPVKPEKYFEILNAFESSNIQLKGDEIFEGTPEHKAVSKMFNETNDDYLVKDGKIFINIGTHFMMYSFNKMPVKTANPSLKKAKEMARDMVYDVFTKDDNTFKTVAAYIANGEFAGKLFMKFNPYYRTIHDIILREYKARIANADLEIDGMQVISLYNKIINNLDNYIISILAARRYLRENNRTLYNGLLTETVRTKDGKEIGYMEALSRRILMEEEIRILKDVKYKQEKSNVTDKTYHIADLLTVGEESEYIRTLYSNDYANMINASENRDVLQQFINAPDKGKFMLEMPIGDAKLLMALFMFDYALMKDAMMFNASSFSKIIDPRLFVNYGKSLTNMQKAFTNGKTLMNEFSITDPKDLNGKLFDTAKMVIENLDSFIKTRDAGIVGASIYETYKPKDLPDAKVIYVGSGLGKTRFIENKKNQADYNYVDFEDILAEALREITQVKYTPAEASMIFGANIEGNIYAKEEQKALAEKLVPKVISLIKNKYKGKTILSTMGNEKIRNIGMEYDSYFVASETNIPNVVERVGKRKDNQYSTTVEKYKYYYVKSILQGVDKNKVFYVDDNFEATFDKMYDGAFGENKPFKMSYDNKNYIVKGEQVFDSNNEDITNILDTGTKARLFAERDFRQGLSELVEVSGEQFYQYLDGLTVFRLKTNSNLTPEGVTRFKQAIAKQPRTEQEQEQETPTVQSVYDEYKSKIEENFGPIEYDVFERIVNEQGIDNIIDLLKNC